MTTNEQSNPVSTEMLSEFKLPAVPFVEWMMRNATVRRFVLGAYNEGAFLAGGPKMADVINVDKETFKQKRVAQQENLISAVDEQFGPYYDKQSRYAKANFGIRVLAASVDKEVGYQSLLTLMAAKQRKESGNLPTQINEQDMEDLMSNDRAVNAYIKLSDIGEFAINLFTPDRNKIAPSFDKTIREHAFANFTELTGIAIKRKQVPKTE